MKYSIVDITLDQFVLDKTDSEMSIFCSLKSKEAVQKCRAERRLDTKKDDTVFVYRLPVSLDWHQFPKTLDSFKNNLREAAVAMDDSLHVLIWSSCFKHELEIVFDPAPSVIKDEITLASIRQAELSDFLHSKEVFYEHSGSALFNLPSKQLSDYFLRVGNLQSKQQFYSAVFFWTIEHLEQVQHIFCDTWSISTTAAVLSEQLMAYRQDTTTESHRVTWSFSPCYLPTSNIREKLVFEAVHSAQKKSGEILFLSSFYSSGTLETSIADVLLDFDVRDQAKLVAIFGVDGEFKYSDDILCSIGDFLKDRGLRGKHSKDDRSKEILDVDRVSFFPDYRSVEPRKFSIADIVQHSKFFKIYCAKKIFSVHRDGRHSKHGANGQARHHAFHVDVEVLFRDDSFVDLLGPALEDATPFDNVIHDGSAGAKALFETVRLQCPKLVANSELFTVLDWRKLANENICLDAINQSGKRTLVLIPTVITGQTIGDLKKHLRQTSLQSMKDMHCVIGLLRPSDHETCNNYLRGDADYVGTGALSVVESVILPNWGKTECPWCIEERTLSNNRGRSEFSSDTKSLLEERQDRLQHGATAGLFQEEVFFVPKHVTDRSLPFYGGSLFKDVLDDDAKVALEELDGLERSKLLIELAENTKVSEADLCLVVANAIQNWRLRTKGTGVKRLTIDAATVSNDDKFNEARLRACIWRALKAEELSLAVRVSQEFSDMLSRIFSSQDDANHRCLELEACLAFGSEIGRVYGGDPDDWNWSDVKFLCFPNITIN